MVSLNKRTPSVSDFELVKPISKGAFGEVYLGYKKTRPEEKLAIKIMDKVHLKNKNMLERVQKEKDALAILEENNHIVKLFYCLQNLDKVYLVMEYHIGGDLKSLLEVIGCFDDYMIAFYSAEIALALNFLNSRQIIHRDVKPDNCLIDRRGHVKLTDFGLAKVQISSDINSMVDKIQCGRTPGQIKSLKTVIGLTNGRGLLWSVQSSQELSPFLEDFYEKKKMKDSAAVKFNFNPEMVAFPTESPEEDQAQLNPCVDVGSKEKVVVTRKRSLADISNCINSDHFKGKIDVQSAPCTVSFKKALVEYEDMATREESETTTSEKSCSVEKLSRIVQHFRITSPGKPDKVVKFEEASSDYDENEVQLLDAHKENLLPDCISDTSLLISRSLKEELCYLSKSEDTSFDNSFESSLSNQHCVSSNVSLVQLDLDNSSMYGSVEEIRRSDFSQTSCNKRLSLTSFYIATPDKQLLCSNMNSNDHKSSINTTCNDDYADLITPEITRSAGREMVFGNVPIFKTPQSTPLRKPLKVTSCRSTTKKSKPHTFSSGYTILGTPDYIAPEIITRSQNEKNEPHLLYSYPVDWWSLGVCMFEFATGFLPFNDETADKVLHNILNSDIPWPTGEEELDKSIVEPIQALLDPCPETRATFEKLKVMPMFDCIEDWDCMLEKQKPPFVPNPCDDYDTDYFKPRNDACNIKMTMSRAAPFSGVASSPSIPR